MSTSSSLSSAKRRRAGGNDQSSSQTTNTVSSLSAALSEDSKHIMSVQDVLYMLNSKIDFLSTRVQSPNNETSSSTDGAMITQITDSIDNMNNTLEQFSEVLGDYEARIQTLEEASSTKALEDKINLLEKRINEKILSKGSEKIDFISKKKGTTTTKDMLAEKVPTKKPVTVDDKFAESVTKKEALKKFEEQSASNDEENLKISFTGLKDKIETNKDN
mgnify:CR=1 FL=1|tara:strand:- start:12832 stop:13485 length:654 start_codon:yes stop_codon:yes gene_type:complete